jgi:hypothetical protein
MLEAQITLLKLTSVAAICRLGLPHAYDGDAPTGSTLRHCFRGQYAPVGSGGLSLTGRRRNLSVKGAVDEFVVEWNVADKTSSRTDNSS